MVVQIGKYLNHLGPVSHLDSIISILHLCFPLGIMLIKVKTLTGKEIEIDIEPTDKVERIKERVEEKEGIPPPQQRLIFSGKQMNDEKTAADYKVQGGSVLHLVLALRGGFQMSYRLYRNTTLGHTLQEALDELMQMQMLSPNLALKVLLQVSTA